MQFVKCHEFEYQWMAIFIVKIVLLISKRLLKDEKESKDDQKLY